MVNDAFGVKQIYPSSTRNPQAWKLSGPNDSRTKSSQLANPNYSGGVISWGTGNDAARWNIMTSAGYQASSINKDHGEIAARGYMMSPQDWRDFEATCYVRLQGGADDQFVIYGRGGSHTGSGNCEGFCYKADLYFSGKTRFAKEQYHVSYEFTNAKNAIGSIEGRWVGMKFCCYNKGNGVQLEIWLDENNNNNWVMKDSRLDSGGWGSEGGHCGGEDDQVGTWGGPYVTWRWDNAESVELQKVSVREITPDGAFNEGGANATAAKGEGGSGNSGSGSGGTGNANAAGNPPQGSSGGTGGKANPFGVRSTYASGQGTDKWKENFRSDGKRFDFTGLGSDNYESAELTGYYAWDDPAEDECSGKMGGGNHTNGSHPKCYDMGIELNSPAASRYRLEENHPSTNGGEDGPNGTPMGSKFIGYRYVKRNQSAGVLLEIWQDTGANESAPANQWKRVASWVEKSKNWQKPPDDHQETLRIDEENGGAKDLRHKWIYLQEILDSDSTTPGGPSTGGGSSGGGSSGGGSGGSSGGSGSGSGCGCGGSGGDGNNDGTNDDTDNDNDNNTDTGEGGGITPTDPVPHITVWRDWSFYLNVGVSTTNDCTQGLALETREPVSILNIPPDVGFFTDLGYAAGQTGNSELGLYIATNQSILFDWPVKRVKVNSLLRTVAPDLSTCTGNLYCEIVNTKTGEVYAQIGGAQGVAGIDTNEQGLVFIQDDNQHMMKVGDAIVLRYKDASATPEKCLKIKHTGTDKMDSMNSHMIGKGPAGYKLSQYATYDIGFEIFV